MRAAAAVPTTNDIDGDGPTPRAQGGPDRPLYEVHINSITLSGWVPELVVSSPESEGTLVVELLAGTLVVAGALGVAWWLRWREV